MEEGQKITYSTYANIIDIGNEKMSNNSSNAEEIFVYTGEGGAAVPQNVVRVRVHPSVTCEGLVEIGDGSFYWCDQSITKINIPNSLRRIKDQAFMCSLRTPIRLHNGIDSIGIYSFAYCIFTNFRVPPLITVIPNSMLSKCFSMFSLELSEDVTEIGWGSLNQCYSLRNVAFPPNAIFGDDIFITENYNEMTDLRLRFGNSNTSIMGAAASI
jgi:hypothetical protein